MESVKLDKLLIQEVSGVDDPANMLPGWMVTKAAGDGSPDLLLVLAGEMELLTKASDSKQPYGDVTYADPGYQKDGKKRYPLDTEEHVRAAWSYINQADNGDLYSAEQLASIKAKIKAAMKKLGAKVEETTTKDASDTIVAKIKGILNLGAPTGKEDDMEKDEFVAALSENNEVLAKAVAEAVSKAVAPAEGESKGAAETTPEVPAALTVEDVTKTVTEVIEEHVTKAYNDLFEKVLDRIEGIETHIGVAARKSLDGQEAGSTEGSTPVTKKAPDLGDAISAAFKR